MRKLLAISVLVLSPLGLSACSSKNQGTQTSSSEPSSSSSQKSSESSTSSSSSKWVTDPKYTAFMDTLNQVIGKMQELQQNFDSLSAADQQAKMQEIDTMKVDLDQKLQEVEVLIDEHKLSVDELNTFTAKSKTFTALSKDLRSKFQ